MKTPAEQQPLTASPWIPLQPQPKMQRHALDRNVRSICHVEASRGSMNVAHSFWRLIGSTSMYDYIIVGAWSAGSRPGGAAGRGSNVGVLGGCSGLQHDLRALVLLVLEGLVGLGSLAELELVCDHEGRVDPASLDVLQ